MSEKICFYLNKLNVKERVLLFILALLFGILLGFNLSQTLFYTLFDKDLLALEEEKRLVQNTQNLHTLTQKQKLELDELNSFLRHFEAQHKSYLDEIYAIATRENISFTNIKNNSNKDELFNINDSFIEFESSFYKSLSFIKGIQNSSLFFEFKELKLTANSQTKTIKSFIHLRFVSSR